MFEFDEDYLIEIGMLNKHGKEDKIIGYQPQDCINCGRHRVELYESGMLVCEKCGFNQKTKEYVDDRYYSPY